MESKGIPPTPSTDMTEAERVRADCRELYRRERLSSTQLLELETSLTSSSSSPDAIRKRVSSLLLHDFDLTIERMRLERNEHEQKSIGVSELAAVAAGGALGAISAWMRPTANLTQPTLWTSAVDNAVATLNVAKHKRSVQQLRLQLMSGDVATCRHVVLCINGFMTQSDDPGRNWRSWTPDDQPDVAVFAVHWEAGDAGAWNDFCAHVNANFATSSALGMLTHFTGNPWHSAQGKAEQVGVLLAHVLAESPALLRDRKLSLFGHSLGGAVIYSTFQEMALLKAQQTEDELNYLPAVTNAVSFAGAFVVPDAPEPLANIAKGLDPEGGAFINVFSSRDNVLSKLFWMLQLPGPATASASAAGCQAIAFTAPNCVNVDVSDLVVPSATNHFGHSYTHVMDVIKARLQPHLFRL
uniref:Fungal lipase-like domain-containing protein n=1 Tax=Peronospora matthiolae TaxID=2874970 RepID=A0AAV1VFS5_9STRA